MSAISEVIRVLETLKKGREKHNFSTEDVEFIDAAIAHLIDYKTTNKIKDYTTTSLQFAAILEFIAKSFGG